MNMMFLFDVVELGSDPRDRFRYNGFDLVDLKKAIKSQGEFAEGTDAWSTVFIENHDQARAISRFGNDSPEFRVLSGKAIAMLQCCLTGTLFIYQGQEIGMTNVPRSWPIEEYKDINTINYYRAFKEKYGKDADYKQKEEKLVDVINRLARDNARTPVQWSHQQYAGFSEVEPWMRVNDNYKEINVEDQDGDDHSLLNFYRKLLKLRGEYKDLFVYGEMKFLDFDDKKLFTFAKEAPGSPVAYIVINFSGEDVKFEPLIKGNYKLVLTNVDKDSKDALSPYEARMYVVD